MGIIYSIVGILIMLGAAGIHAWGPTVDFTDSFSVERFVYIATRSMGALGLAMTIMGVVPARGKKTL